MKDNIIKGASILSVILMCSMVLTPVVSAAPPQPFNRWGYAWNGSGALLDTQVITAWIDGVEYGRDTTGTGADNGLFSIDTAGDTDKGLGTQKDGGYNNTDTIYYVHGDLTTTCAFFTATNIWVTGGFNQVRADMNLTLTPPARLKITALSSAPTAYVAIYNPTGAPVDVYTFSLAVGTAAPLPIIAGDRWDGVNPLAAAGTIWINMAKWGGISTTGNAVRLIQTATSFVVDRVEYGTIAAEPENTILTDAANPAATQEIHRTPSAFTDTNSCVVDFTTGPAHTVTGDTATATATIPVLGTPTTDTTPQITYTHTGGPANVVFYYTNNGGTTWFSWDTDGTVTGPPDTFQTTTALPGSGTYGIMAKSPSEPVPSGAGSIEITPYIVDVTGPSITATVPINGAIGVVITDNVVVTFNEPVNPASLTYTCAPPGIVFALGWTGAQTIVTFYHNGTPFTAATLYTFQITACTDVLGNALVAGAIQNPWTFTTAGGAGGVSPTDIAVHKQGATDILIDWTTGSPPWEIWRSNSVTGGGFALYASGVAVMNYLDAGALADANNYAYIVRGATTLVNSNMGWKLVKPLPINGLAYSWIALPYKCDLTTADQVMDSINADAGFDNTCNIVTRWDTAAQGFVSRTDMGAIRVGTNFAITAGSGYQVHCVVNPVTWKIVGAAQNVGTTVSVPLVNNGLAYTWIALPYNTLLLVADNVMDQINTDTLPGIGDDINIFTRWDEAAQGFVSRTDMGAIRVGTNFATNPGSGYQVHMINANAGWIISNNVLYP